MGPICHVLTSQVLTTAQRLASVNEETWLQVGATINFPVLRSGAARTKINPLLGKVAELMNDLDRAMAAYESALRQNPYSIPAMNQIATILRAREQFPRVKTGPRDYICSRLLTMW